jgi:hypothetical protein
MSHSPRPDARLQGGSGDDGRDVDAIALVRDFDRAAGVVDPDADLVGAAAGGVADRIAACLGKGNLHGIAAAWVDLPGSEQTTYKLPRLRYRPGLAGQPQPLIG